MFKSYLLYSIFILALFLFILPADIQAIEINNSSFESIEEGWIKTTSAVQFESIESPYFEASHSAEIFNASATSNGIKQSISPIVAETTYHVGVHIKTLSAQKAFLRIAWYQAGSASQLKTDDAPIIAANANWSLSEIILSPPPNASSAEIRLLVSEGTAYFDNVFFKEITQPTETISPTPSLVQPSATPMPTQSPTPTLATSYDHVYISEVLVYPDAGISEWVELYNQNVFPVTLNNWYLDDMAESGSLPKLISLTIPSQSYATLEMTTALFNNGGDTIRLLDANKILKDSITYTAALKNYSIGRNVYANENVCLQIPTKGIANNPCISVYTDDDDDEEPILTNITQSYPQLSPTRTQPTPKLLPSGKKQAITKAKTTSTPNPSIVERNAHIQPLRNDTKKTPDRRSMFIASTYSVLSFISIGVKMILTRTNH